MNEKKDKYRPNSKTHHGTKDSNHSTKTHPFSFLFFSRKCIEVLGEQVLYFRKGGRKGGLGWLPYGGLAQLGYIPIISYPILFYPIFIRSV